MKTPPFVKKPIRSGPSYLITIPRDYIKHGLVDPTRKLKVILESIDDEPAVKQDQEVNHNA